MLKRAGGGLHRVVEAAHFMSHPCGDEIIAHCLKKGNDRSEICVLVCPAAGTARAQVASGGKDIRCNSQGEKEEPPPFKTISLGTHLRKENKLL